MLLGAGKECQQAHWAAHKEPCKAGVAAYLDAIAGQVRRQAELLKRADVAEAVIAELERMLEMAQAIGDPEGERHLCSTLAYRFKSLAESGGDRAAEHSARAEQLAARAAAIADCIGPQDYKGFAQAAVGGEGPHRSKLPSMQSSVGGAASGTTTSTPNLGAMFGAPTDGDPLGLLSDFGAMPGRLPAESVATPASRTLMPQTPAPAVETPPSPPDDRPA